MGKHKILLEKWQNILDAMSKIDNDDQSRYFSDFCSEVKKRIYEYEFLAEKEEKKFNNVPFPFEAELNEFEEDNF